MDLLNDSDVRDIINEINTSQVKRRREDEIKAFEVYSGDLSFHVKKRLKELYPQTHASFSISDLNISRKIVDKQSKSYKQNPLRELDNTRETEAYSSYMKEMDAQAAWQWFDIYYNLHRHACMWFNYIAMEDGSRRLVLRPLNPSQFFRITDDIGDTKVFIVNFPDYTLYESDDSDGFSSNIQDSQQDSVTYRRYAIWTKEQHIVVMYDHKKDKIVRQQIKGNEESVNDLGIIPAAFAQQGDNSALPIRNPLTNQAIEFNQQYAVMLTSCSLQSFGHLVLSHPEDQEQPSEIYNSLFTYSTLPQKLGDTPTTLDYLNPQPDLNAQLQVLQNYGHQIITEHLGDGAQTVNGSDNFTSGLDRMIAMSDVSNLIESNQQIYVKAENQLFDVIKAYAEVSGEFRFSSEDITIKYPKAKPIQSEAEILDNIKKKLDLGLIEKYEAIIMLDPNMTAEQAREKLARVQEEKEAQMSQMFGDVDADQEE